METALRHPQIINGEIQPRNYYIGLESVRRLNGMRKAFQAEGVNLMAIPMINEVEQGIRDESLEPGTVVGVRPPTNENDPTGVLVWDGFGIVGVSFMTFHRRENSGWILGELSKPTVANITTEKKEKEKKKKKRTTPKHELKRKIKARNGRRV